MHDDGISDDIGDTLTIIIIALFTIVLAWGMISLITSAGKGHMMTADELHQVYMEEEHRAQ